MPDLQTQPNPFILMMDPQAVLAKIEHSERLERLHSRICRPLDKPQLQAAASGSDLARHDLGIDAELDDAE
jgi:hypothetical protein